LANYFDLDLNPTAIGLTLVLLVTLSQLYGSTADWRNRTIFIFGAILLLPLLLVWAFLFPPVEAAGYAYLLTGDNLQAVPYLAISLWGISFVLDRRDQMQRPERRILWVLLLVVGITAVLGAWLAVMLLQYPLLIAGNLTPLLALAAALNPNFELLLMLGSLGLALFGLGQVVVRLVHLAGLMTANGFLPPEFQRTVSAHQYPVYALLFLVSLLGIILLLVSPALIVTAASGTLMLALALVHLPGLLSTKSPLPPDRGWKLPLHPLFSALSVALTLTMLFLPPVTNQILLTIWLAVGIGFYFLYARQSSIAVRQQEEGVGEWELTADSTQEHMMVAVQDVAQSAELVATAVKLAQAREAQLFVLQVMVMPEQAPHPQQREAAEAAWQRLANRLQQLETGDVLIHPLVRLAPDVKAGILTTIWEENIKTLIVGWPDGHEDRLTVPDDVVTEVVPRANCEVIIPRGALPPSLNRVLVPLMSEGHAPAALAWGQALARQDEGTVVALGLMREALTPERSAAAYGRVQEIIAKLDDKRGVEPLIEQAKNPKVQIIATAQNYDLTLLGVSDEGFLAQTRFGGMPTEIALTSSQPVFLVKSREATSRFWLRRTWERLFELLPTLTASEQAAVYLNMRHSGKASIDFYVLMILAAAIAYFGLLQDSDAVVIGAMLVAPLMNPILALSQGIVQGNIRLMRTAAATTFNGAITAVALTTFVTMFFLSLGNNAAATDAILSRTSPGMLDLLVALVSGAAAAYATSRSNVAGALPGVAIAAALVPPLAVVGYGLGLTQFEIATGALLLFLTNLAAIILAGAVTFLLLGFRPPLRMERDDQTKFGLRVALVGLLLISIPLVLASVTSRIQTGNTAEINHTLSSYWLPNEALVTDILIERNRRTLTVSFTVLDFTGQIGTADIAALQEELSTAVERSVVVQAVITRSELEVV
ncbi:MAG: DUF389 domain-containing protein, partial [Chloroflexi bacterium]|nr:DUF389 domain-containing protein [Chloroflexota bacterium]